MGSTASPKFEDILAKATARGSNGIPGCVLAAIEKNGHYIYKNTAGYHSAASNSPPINPDGTFWIASCTKLLTSICALQMVEQGLISLDEDVSRILPELKNPSIIQLDDKADHGFTLTPAKGYVTLRHLLTHTSGVGYNFLSDALIAWRNAVGPDPEKLRGKVVETFTAPLLFEPGSGWAYGGGVDWAGGIVHRLSGKRLDVYMADHIFKPLGMNSSTFQLDARPNIKDRLVACSRRLDNGALVEHDEPLWPHAVEEPSGGAGLWSSVEDYMKVLRDLLQTESKLLKQQTVEDMLFKPQIPPDHPALGQLQAARAAMNSNAAAVDTGINHGLGGMVLTADSDISGLPKGTLTWGGYPNLKWMVNREYGVAAMYASQLLPPGDAKSVELSSDFFKEVMRLVREKGKSAT